MPLKNIKQFRCFSKRSLTVWTDRIEDLELCASSGSKIRCDDAMDTKFDVKNKRFDAMDIKFY